MTIFFPSIATTTLLKINCHNFFFLLCQQFHCHKLIATIFFPFHFGNSIAINQLPQFFFFFSSNFRSKLLLNLSPHFRQLLLPKITIKFLPDFSATWLPQLVSFQPLLLRALHLTAGQQMRAARILVMRLSKFKSSHHITCLSSLILFVRISATVLQNSLCFLNFSNNFEQYLYHK